MRMKMLTFSFGVITGAALLISYPYLSKWMKEIKDKADQEIHATKKVLLRKTTRIKDGIEDSIENINEEVNELIDTISYELGSLDINGLSASSKRAFNKIKTHVITLKNELLK